MSCHHFTQRVTRRAMLRTSAGGFGHLALLALAARSGLVATNASASPSPLAPPTPHFAPRAKRVIFLFMWGGPSHIDLFDPKPRLTADAGKPLSGSSVGSERDQLGKLLGSPFRFSQHGDGGIWMCELFPHLSRHADRMCMIRSLHTEGTAHGEAL